MSLGGGIFGGNSLGAIGDGLAGSGMPGLGLVRHGAGALGWTSHDCWSPPGGINPNDSAFKACHDKQLSSAQSNCYTLQATPDGFEKRGFTGFDDCVRKTRDVLIDANCLQFCVAMAANYRGGDPCRSTSAVKYAQKKLGVAQDGSWGTESQNALVSSGFTFQGLIGCTGPCPTKVGDLCTGDCQTDFEIDPATGLCARKGPAEVVCAANFHVEGGLCVPNAPPPPQKCGAGEELVNGVCLPHAAPKTKKAGMLWLGLAALGALGIAGYALSQQKKKGRRGRRRR